MSAFEQYSLQPSSEAWDPAWIARGELRGQRFELPTGVSSVTFDRARLVNVDFSGTRFAEFTVHGSEFEECDFTNAIFEQLSMGTTCVRGTWDGAGWPQSVFRGSVFRRTRFAPSTFFGNVRFERCTFDRSRLRDQTSTFEAEFVDCVFLGRVRNINFWGRCASSCSPRPEYGSRGSIRAGSVLPTQRTLCARRSRRPSPASAPPPPGHASRTRQARRHGMGRARVEEPHRRTGAASGTDTRSLFARDLLHSMIS